MKEKSVRKGVPFLSVAMDVLTVFFFILLLIDGPTIEAWRVAISTPCLLMLTSDKR